MNKYLVYITLMFSVSACIEPFDFETRDASGILVVQATISDKTGKQIVILTRAASLENVNVAPRDSLNVNRPLLSTAGERANPEIGADVRLLDEFGNEFTFNDQGRGVYESENSFALQQGVRYQLKIITTNSETYESDVKSLAGESQINGISAERNFNANGEEGVTIFADGSDISGSSDYFRFGYTETYQIIVPNYSGLELEVVREQIEMVNDSTFLFPDVKLVRRAQEEQTCYNTESSRDVNIASTAVLASPEVKRHVVRFLNRDNPIISHRYSILLKQYVIDNETYNYYQNLNNFAQSESVFSEIQPGFLEGNIKRTDVDDGLVLGYFEVASISEKRFFFDYVDFFPDEELPPFFGDINCDRFVAPALGNPEKDGPQPLGCPPASLIRGIQNGLIEYIGINEPPGECEGPYLMTFRACGDCTLLGSNIKPDFWIDREG